MSECKIKTCYSCNAEYKPTGRCQKYCSSCKSSGKLDENRKQIAKKYRDKPESKQLVYARQMNTVLERMIKRAKKRAQKKNLDFDLTIADLALPDVCPYLKVPFTNIMGKGHSPFNPSLDRIDSSKGYTKDNTEIISYLANTMKSNATIEQLETFALSTLTKTGYYD